MSLKTIFCGAFLILSTTLAHAAETKIVTCQLFEPNSMSDYTVRQELQLEGQPVIKEGTDYDLKLQVWSAAGTLVIIDKKTKLIAAEADFSFNSATKEKQLARIQFTAKDESTSKNRVVVGLCMFTTKAANK